ncbi:DUF4158 domain-containing protein [Streptosporangium sp. NBC_01756]|uniref:DUF4158 domain-containing protein n=1 Tax=Streptosporangium sp. NBC_01756 TaxID=2975950 RepID=UPI002DD84ADB|nr:DUF4158 domain-containing protein [Streptosporangium sp. NBC_01756]WSC86517.1 DUF4158 domain-containing protein [Streptosporangium sp. NBC_01756]
MPVEFLTDEQAEAYGTFSQVSTRPELERFFFLDDDDRDLIALRRTNAHRLGMAVQICLPALSRRRVKEFVHQGCEGSAVSPRPVP